MQNSFYLHTNYENMGKIYLYPIWEFLKPIRFFSTSAKTLSTSFSHDALIGKNTREIAYPCRVELIATSSRKLLCAPSQNRT